MKFFKREKAYYVYMKSDSRRYRWYLTSYSGGVPKWSDDRPYPRLMSKSEAVKAAYDLKDAVSASWELRIGEIGI